MAKKRTGFDFEQSLAELEALVTSMERGDLSLEDSLQGFERGVQLARACHAALADAEQKVRILLEKEGRETLEPLASGPTEDDDAAPL